MKAWAMVEHCKELQLLELPMPTPRGSEVVLEVMHCGLCHTDLHMWEGYYDLGGGRKMSIADRGVTLPLAMGHEIVGKVASFGPDATDVKLGDARIVFPWIGCGQCEACTSEEDNMCLQGQPLGILRHGGHASHVKVPHPRYLIDPGQIPLPTAATLACSGITAYSAVRKLLPLPTSEPVVVIGAGGLGLMAIALMRALDHRHIIAVDVSKEKLLAASRLGATATVLSDDGSKNTEALIGACGRRPRAIIDFVNGSQTAQFAFASLEKGGKLVQVGLMGGELVLPLPLMAMRALTVQGSYVGTPKELRELVAIVQKDGTSQVPIEQIPMGEINSALQRLRAGHVTGRLVLCGCAGQS